VLALRDFADAPGFARTMKAISQAEGFTGDDSIRCPVTVAWGTRDRLLRPAQLARAGERMPFARLELLEACGHVPTWDDPGRVMSLLANVPARR
jgi:pimeloyl-ACP methyl ester carboxylesterase